MLPLCASETVLLPMSVAPVSVVSAEPCSFAYTSYLTRPAEDAGELNVSTFAEVVVEMLTDRSFIAAGVTFTACVKETADWAPSWTYAVTLYHTEVPGAMKFVGSM